MNLVASSVSVAFLHEGYRCSVNPADDGSGTHRHCLHHVPHPHHHLETAPRIVREVLLGNLN